MVSIMTPENRKTMQRLVDEIQTEQNTAKFTGLVEELNQLMEDDRKNVLEPHTSVKK